MKKLFLLFAFTGIVGAASATTLLTSTPATIVSVKGDPIKGDDKKKKDEKACCKKDAAGKHTADASGKACSGEAKACSGEKATGKTCCKSKGTATAATTSTTETTKTEK